MITVALIAALLSVGELSHNNIGVQRRRRLGHESATPIVVGIRLLFIVAVLSVTDTAVITATVVCVTVVGEPVSARLEYGRGGSTLLAKIPVIIRG